VTVGVGGRENDYRAVGAPFTHRHQRLDDQVAEMKKVWRGEPLWEGADEVGPCRLVAGGDHGPGGQGLPGRYAHRLFEYGHGYRLLHGVHHLRLDRIDVAGEMADEIVL